MKRIGGVGVILLVTSLAVVIGVPRLQAQEGTCLILAEIAVGAMKVGYDTQSYEACQELVDGLLEKNREDPLPLAWQPFFARVVDLVAKSCVKGIELAEAQKPFLREEFLKIFYYACINGE